MPSGNSSPLQITRRTPAQARAELVKLRHSVISHVAKSGLRVAAAGTHPFSSWVTQEITPLETLEQADRLVDFLTRAELLALARSDWDLLLMYQPEIDETGHEFLLVDPRQPRGALEDRRAGADRDGGKAQCHAGDELSSPDYRG